MSTYCFSDIHGNLQLWRLVQDFLKPEDKVYFLGDAIDRGPDGLQIMKELLADERVTYIMGNHEEFFFRATKELLNDECYNSLSDTFLWLENGGQPTYEAWLKNPEPVSAASMSRFEIYHNKEGKTILLSHAGFTPPMTSDYSQLLQDRTHFDDKWPEGFENYIIVHGHTPVQYFSAKEKGSIISKPGPYYYCDGHKIDIDLGTADSGLLTLLNLDTFKAVTFF